MLFGCGYDASGPGRTSVQSNGRFLNGDHVFASNGNGWVVTCDEGIDNAWSEIAEGIRECYCDAIDAAKVVDGVSADSHECKRRTTHSRYAHQFSQPR